MWGSVLGGAIAAGASLAALLLRAAAGPVFSIAAAASLLACAGVAIVASRRGGLAVGAAIGAAFALAPNVLFGATWVLSQPLGDIRYGAANVALPFAPIVTVFVGTTFAIPVAMLAQTVARDTLRALVTAAAAITVAGAVASGVGAASLRRPDPDAYVSTHATRAGTPIYVYQVARELGAPRGWVAGSLAGVACAAIALLGAAASRRRARGLVSGAVEAVHEGGGWIVLSGTRSHAPELEDAARGPVVVRAGASRAATYRHDGAPDVIVLHEGTLESMAATLRERAGGWACVAIAAVATTCAPRWAASLCGIL